MLEVSSCDHRGPAHLGAHFCGGRSTWTVTGFTKDPGWLPAGAGSAGVQVDAVRYSAARRLRQAQPQDALVRASATGWQDAAIPDAGRVPDVELAETDCNPC